jgi:ADP-ribose pyrophosphatase
MTENASEGPKIRSRHITTISPWTSIIAREVEFTPGAVPEIYHAVAQADYVGVIAITPEGLFPLVRQYRPVLEAYTWELPAGTVDGDEDPADSAQRELLEETGYPTLTLRSLGTTCPCTGRLNNRLHGFLIETGPRIADFEPEPGMSVDLVTLARLFDMIRSGEFVAQQHIGALLQAALYGFLDLNPLLPGATKG